MALFLVTDVTTEPVTLAEAKAHCRVDHSDDDTLLGTLIIAVRQHVETFTHRALAPQTWEYKVDAFPYGWYHPLVLPKPPVTAITSVSYTDPLGITQTWSATNYTTDLPSGPWAGPGRILPNYGVIWPVTQAVLNAVTVRFVAGYTVTPEAIKAGMKLLTAHWYKNREAALTDLQTETLPMAVEALLWPFKAFV